MRDKRPVDELSIEELERVLAIKKREARQQQLKRMKQAGRLVDQPPAVPKPAPVMQPVPEPVAQQQAEAKKAAPFELPFVPGVEPAQPEEAPVEAQPEPAAPARPLPPSVRSSVPRFDDDPELTGLDGDSRRDDEAWRRFVNGVLLLVEVAAVAGLVFLGVNMVTAIGTLERETAEAQDMANEQRLASIPSPEPTPTIRLQDVVLPGGHTFTENNVAIFNENEIPPQVLPRVQSQLYQQVLSRPEPTDNTALEIQIPALNIRQSIVQGTDWEALKQGVGQVLNGVTPADEQGNVVLAAHNDIYGELFRYLDELEIGDEFYIFTQEGEVYTYRVTGYDIVEPTEVSVMENLPGEATATLISCYPYRVNSHRYVVFAERVS